MEMWGCRDLIRGLVVFLQLSSTVIQVRIFFLKLENGLLFPATNLRKIHKILKLKSYKSTLTQNFI